MTIEEIISSLLEQCHKNAPRNVYKDEGQSTMDSNHDPTRESGRPTDMTTQTDITTAMLAAVYGVTLLTTKARDGGKSSLSPRIARELAVLSRVLENRLREARSAFESTA